MANRKALKDGAAEIWSAWDGKSFVVIDDMKLRSYGFTFKKNGKGSERQQRLRFVRFEMEAPILIHKPGIHLYIKYNWEFYDGDMPRFTDLSKPGNAVHPILSKPQQEPKQPKAKRSRKPKVEANPELEALREQVAAMQAVLDKLVA